MKIAIKSNAYFDNNLTQGFEQGLATMRAHGYDGFDFQGFIAMNDGLISLSQSEWEKKLNSLRTAAQNEGLYVCQAHAPGRYPPQDATEADRNDRFLTKVRALEGAAMLECPYLVVHPILPYGTKVNVNPDGVWKINVEFFSRLADKAKEYGVTLCYENMPFKVFPFSKPEYVIKMVKEVNHPYFKCCLDTGHAALYEDVSDSVRTMGDSLVTVHVHDNDGDGDKHWLPYTGVIDWKGFCKALGEIDFNGYFSLECMVRGNYPPKLLEYYRIGLAKTARMLADAVEREKSL